MSDKIRSCGAVKRWFRHPSFAVWHRWHLYLEGPPFRVGSTYKLPYNTTNRHHVSWNDPFLGSGRPDPQHRGRLKNIRKVLPAASLSSQWYINPLLSFPSYNTTGRNNS